MCAADPLVELEKELNAYVGLRRTYGAEPEYDFRDALKLHRRQVLENMRDDGDESWFRRNSLLEKLADQRGIDLTGEPEVREIVASHRARRGRSETLW